MWESLLRPALDLRLRRLPPLSITSSSTTSRRRERRGGRRATELPSSSTTTSDIVADVAVLGSLEKRRPEPRARNIRYRMKMKPRTLPMMTPATAPGERPFVLYVPGMKAVEERLRMVEVMMFRGDRKDTWDFCSKGDEVRRLMFGSGGSGGICGFGIGVIVFG